MKHAAKSFLCLSLLSCALAFADCCDSNSTNCNDCCSSAHTIYVPFSAGADILRDPMYRHYRYDSDECWYVDLNLIYQHKQTRNGCHIAQYLFGANPLVFQGSTLADRSSTALVADYFGLAQATTPTAPGNDSTNLSLSFDPQIKNDIFDITMHIGLDGLYEGLYFHVSAPVVRSKWSLGAGCSQDCNDCCGVNTATNVLDQDTTGTFVGGYMNSVANRGIDTNPQPANIAGATSLRQALGLEFTFGDKSAATKYGRFCLGNASTNNCNDCCSSNDCGSSCSNHETKLADLHMTLGYDFWKCQDYHVGAFIRLVAPTGTRIDQCYAQCVFSPLVGNGRHWELGGGLTAHAELWSCDNSSFAAYFEGYATHMFKKESFRSFDLANKPMSRYALLKVFDSAQARPYQGQLIHAIDYTSRCVDTKFDARGEAVIDLVYRWCNWELGFGYALQGQSREKLDCDNCNNDCNDCCNTSTTSSTIRYGLKGGQPVARDFGGGNWGPAVATASNATAYSVGTSDGLTTPVYLPTDDSGIDAASGLQCSQFLNRIFGHIDYRWEDACWRPTLGVLASVGFASDSRKGATPEYWDIAIRGGIEF